MQVKLDIDEIFKLKLTPSEYLLLYVKYHNESLLDLNFISHLGIRIDNIVKLEDKGYIKVTGFDLTSFVLREPAKNLFNQNVDDTKFYEFYGTYPMKVPNGAGGFRVLRSKDPNAQSAEKIKSKYLRLIKKSGVHKQIMEGLDGYLKEYRPKMQYLQGIEVFLNQATWEKYIGVRDVEKEGFSNDI